MKKYVSTKTRKGAVIVSCEVSQKFVVVSVPVEEPTDEQKEAGIESVEQRMRVPDNFFGRGVPVAGDYFLLYDGGYTSWCPKAEFEAGHKEVVDGEELPDTSELEDQVAALTIQNGELATDKSKLESSLAETSTELEKAKDDLATANATIASHAETAKADKPAKEEKK